MGVGEVKARLEAELGGMGDAWDSADIETRGYAHGLSVALGVIGLAEDDGHPGWDLRRVVSSLERELAIAESNACNSTGGLIDKGMARALARALGLMQEAGYGGSQ